MNNYIKVIILGICFLFTFTVYFSAYFIVSQIYDQNNKKNLGQITIFVNYLSLGICNMFVPQLLKKFSSKQLMIVGAIGLTTFPLTATFTVFCADSKNEYNICNDMIVGLNVVISIMICGAFGATLWVAQSKYVTDISLVKNRGKYFGTFWALMQTSQVTGNLLTFFLLGKFSHLQFLSILTASSIVYLRFIKISGALYFLIPMSYESVSVIEEQDVLKRKEVVQISSSFETIKLIITPQVRRYLPLFTLSGVIIGFYSGFLYKVIQDSILETDDKTVNQKTTLVFVFLGIFEMIGGIVSGFLLDRYNQYLLGTVSTIFVQISITVSILTLFELNYTLCFICGACWGLSDCFIQNVITVLCSDKQFGGSVSIFCIFRLFQALGVTITLVLIIILENSPGYIILILMAIFQMVTNMSTLQLDGRKQE